MPPLYSGGSSLNARKCACLLGAGLGGVEMGAAAGAAVSAVAASAVAATAGVASGSAVAEVSEAAG
jgi:hypothetical protein